MGKGNGSEYRIEEMKKGKKIRVIGGYLILAAVLLMGGCGAKEQTGTEENIEVENVASVEATAIPTATPAPTPEPTATPKPFATWAPTATPVPLDFIFGFDEEFVINRSETRYVGRDDVCITIGDRYNYVDGNIGFGYTLKVGEECYDGTVLWTHKEGISVRQDKFSMNRVLCSDVDITKESITLMITETTDIKKPLELSSNPEDEYVTTQPEYVETDDFILFLDEGIKVYGNTVEQITTILKLVEKETGLSCDNKPNYTPAEISGPVFLFGDEEFMGIDPDMEKYHIYVVSHDRFKPVGGYSHMVLNPIDLEIAAGKGDVIVHEYVHSLHVARGPWVSRWLSEGYATYITAQITEKDEVVPFNFDAYFNYSEYGTEITKENAEEIALSIENNTFDNYMYGFRIVHFLAETYGQDVFCKILDEACLMVEENRNEINDEKTIECIKKCTSETVFEEFGDWMITNKDRFEQGDI